MLDSSWWKLPKTECVCDSEAGSVWRMVLDIRNNGDYRWETQSVGDVEVNLAGLEGGHVVTQAQVGQMTQVRSPWKLALDIRNSGRYR